MNDDNYLAMLGSIAAVCNAIRFIWSSALDVAPYKLVYGSLLIMQVILDFTISLVSSNKTLYALWVSLILFCEGGHFTLVPNVLKKIYGEKATFLYGIMFSYTGVCSALMMILEAAFVSHTVRSYNIIFAVSGLLSLCSFFILKRYFTQKKFYA